MIQTCASIQGLLGKNVFRRPPVEHMCRPESCGIADWAARRLYDVLCEWNSRARDRHYYVKKWPLQGEMIQGEKNVAHRALVDKTKIYLPQLHIELGLINMFVKAMSEEGEGFIYVREIFPHISEAKIEEGIFVGPEVKRLSQYTDFRNQLNSVGGRAWQAFENVCSNFWEMKDQKIRRNCGGATFLILCLGMQHVIESPFPAVSLGFFPVKCGSRL